MQFKLSEVKDLLVEIFNNPEVPAIDIHKVVNEKLSKLHNEEINLSSDLIRMAYEKLGMNLRNRPRKQKDTIIFEEEVETPITLTNSVVGDIETEF